MKHRAYFSMALLLVAAAWATGCAGKPTAIAPTVEPMTAQPGGAQTGLSAPSAASPNEETTMTPTISPEPTEAKLPAKVEPPAGGGGVVQLAKEDLARRLGVSVDGITVVAVIGQEFSTDAFYCRTTKGRVARDEPPIAVSGESILLSASDHRYEYHASNQTVVFCRPLP